MTSIKPPDGRSPAGGVPPASSGSRGPDGPERTGPSFRDALDGASATNSTAGASPSSAGGAQSGAADPIRELAQAVQTGALTADQALEQLVERVAGQVGRRLTPAQRTELTAVLQTALQSDPALGALRQALG
jgi:hypothetical protein